MFSQSTSAIFNEALSLLETTLRRGAKPEPGAEPRRVLATNGGAEPRLTSGGKAVA